MRLYSIVIFTAFCLVMHTGPGLAQEQTATATDSSTPQTQGEKAKTENSKNGKNTETDQSYNLQPIVVTGTKTPVPLSETTKDVNVVTNQDMQTFQQVSIPETLDTVPGVMVQNQGGPGQYSPVDIRGAGSEYTLFQFDGFPLRDAADTQCTFQYLSNDLNGLSGINRIEILNGTNSVLYGSSSMGGVVNIIPQKWGSGFSGELMSEIAPDGTFIENGGVSYGNDKYYINLNPTYITTNGITNGGPDSYWYHNFSVNGSAGIKFGDNMSLELFNLTSTSDQALTVPSFYYYSLNAQNQLLPNLASPNDHEEVLFSLTGVTFSQVVCPVWDYSIKYAYGSTQRDYYEPQGNYGDTEGMDLNGSTNWVEMQHNVRPTDWLTLTGGVDFDQESYQNVLPLIAYNPVTYAPYWNGENVSTGMSWYGYDLFGLAQTAFFDKALLINAGLRFNDHEDFASKVVEEISAAYIFDQTGTKIHTAFGTGYRTPSLYEIYGGYVDPTGQLVTVGNPDLKPEEDTSYDVGITQQLYNDKITCDVTLFYMDFNSIIYYNGFTNMYDNGSDGKTTGIEAKIEAKPCKYVTIGASYTYAFAQYKPDSSSQWTRVNYWPMDTFAVTGTVRPIDRLSISMKVLWEGDRIIPLYNIDGDAINYNEASDVRVDMSATYTILKNYEGFRDVDLFMKITNLFDEHYTEAGYQMPGQWIWGGVKMTF